MITILDAEGKGVATFDEKDRTVAEACIEAWNKVPSSEMRWTPPFTAKDDGED